jgi:hypothetical protein
VRVSITSGEPFRHANGRQESQGAMLALDGWLPGELGSVAPESRIMRNELRDDSPHKVPQFASLPVTVFTCLALFILRQQNFVWTEQFPKNRSQFLALGAIIPSLSSPLYETVSYRIRASSETWTS